VKKSATLENLLLVLSGGMVGTVLRYFFYITFPRTSGGFPWVTFSENIVGAFLLGIALIFLLESRPIQKRMVLFFGTGVLGSFTTFSNLSLEIVYLIREERLDLALLYLFTSAALGLASAFAGMALGNTIHSRRKYA